MEELLRDIRNQLFLNQAYDLRRYFGKDTPPEDLEDVADPGEEPQMLLTIDAALRVVARRHAYFGPMIERFIVEASKQITAAQSAQAPDGSPEAP